MPLTKIEEEISNPQLAQIGLQTSGKTWNAISVSQDGNGGVGDVGNFGLYILDEDTGVKYHDRDGTPFAIPYGHAVSGNCNLRNTGDVPIKLFALTEVIDPNGSVIFSKWEPRGSIPNTLNPGVAMAARHIDTFLLELVGIWVVYLRVEFEIA